MNQLFLAVVLFHSIAYSQNDTTSVRSHNRVDLTWYEGYDAIANFPEEGPHEKILMDFTMGCASGGCSHWDYTVSVFVITPTGLMDSTAVMDTLSTEPIEIDTTWNVYERKEKFELARLITPYGNYMDWDQSWDPNDLYNDDWEHSYSFDVTDFAPLLKGASTIQVHYGGWSSGFSATVDFHFIKGTPAREVLAVENMYPVGEYSYRSLADDENFPAITKVFDEPIKGVAIKSYISGHKHAGPQSCCEWISKQHSLAIQGNERFQWDVWKDCGRIPIYPQGGTWPFDRAGWCPGTAVDLQVSELTDFIDWSAQVELDYRVQPYSISGEDTGTFIVSNTLFSYGDINFEKDVEITDIIQPTTKDEWSRMNPICANPVIEIRNRGSKPLTSVTVRYGLEGKELSSYEWTGRIEFMESEWVDLLIPDWTGASEDSKFIVTVSIDGDEYMSNNTLTSDFDIPEVLPNEFVFEFRTQRNYNATDRAAESSYYINDSEGELVFEHSSPLEPYTWYIDTIRLPEGCYELIFEDSAENGVNEHWYSGEASNGAGIIRIRNMNGQVIKKFPDDFGQQLDYRFTVTYPLEVQFIDDPIFDVYPNPVNDLMVLSLSLPHAEDVDFILYSNIGDEIRRFRRKNFTSGTETINLQGLSSGVYFVKVLTRTSEQVKKFVVVD